MDLRLKKLNLHNTYWEENVVLMKLVTGRHIQEDGTPTVSDSCGRVPTTPLIIRRSLGSHWVGFTLTNMT